jgi:phosphate-selective porin OprO/OprP
MGARSLLGPLLITVGALGIGGAMPTLARAQAVVPATPGPLPPSGAETPESRLARIESLLQTLQTQNQQLQQQYDALAQKYQGFQDGSGADPGTAEESEEVEEPGIPGGLDRGHWSPDSKQEEEAGGARARSSGESRSARSSGAATQMAGQAPGERLGERSIAEVLAYWGVGTGEFGRIGAGAPSARSPRAATQMPGQAPGERLRGPKASRGTMLDYVDRRGPYVLDMRPERVPATVSFREGLEIAGPDDLFTLQFHNLSQLDYRQFSQTGDALHDNFVVPRQRWYFQGDVTPYAYFYTVINRGYGSLDVLDSWVDFSPFPQYKEQFQLRVGRQKTPYTYEYIRISESDLIAPERSLFVGNFAGNRELGVTAHGYFFNRSLQYFAGVFNGPRRSFQDFNNDKDLFGFLNWQPFLHAGVDWLKYLNIAGSLNGGDERNPTQPIALVTANDQSPQSSSAVVNVSPTFLIFNPKAFENGARLQWAADVAYYYKSFTLLSNVEGGFQDYSLQGSGTLPSVNAYGGFASGAFVGVGSPHVTRVPLAGWSCACTYFLTGEEISRRVYLLEPRRPFGYYGGRWNPGAIEVYSRFADLQLGADVFSSGIADPKLWANRANTVDTGINWYWNHYVRLYFDWQHSMFNRPVFLSDTKSTRHNDLFWIRTQVFF